MTTVDSATIRADIVRRNNRRRKTRIVLIAAIVLAVTVVASVVVLGTMREQKITLTAQELPPGASETDYGITVGSGPVVVDEYFDFLCPACRQTNQAVHARMAELVDSGQISVRYHPMAKLDDYSKPAGYSTRAALASACAAEQGQFADYMQRLLVDQPAENGPGFSDVQLTEKAGQLGMNTDTFSACLASDRYQRWVTGVTQRAETEVGVVATPTILVDGKAIPVAKEKVRAALSSAVG